MVQEADISFPLRVATFELLGVSATGPGAGPGSEATCELLLRDRNRAESKLVGTGGTMESATAAAISQLCIKPITLTATQATDSGGQHRVIVTAAETAQAGRAGVGRFLGTQGQVASQSGLVVAALRAASNGGMLKAAYRANNQKVMRGWSAELIEELSVVLETTELDSSRRMEAEGVVLEHMNRVASAAVVTATNHPRPDAMLSLFDTTAWLVDASGERRESFTGTDFWLAWYPGVDSGSQTVSDVIESMPQAPSAKIPWIVKLFENPNSWIRFRGAVNLEDHDVLHVLLGRGLQDQDEAFVIGFAMGTAKRVSWFQYWVFKFVIGRLYPEPYRIPKYLQPAFNLGVECGQATGAKNLYKQDLQTLRDLPLDEARQQVGIDVDVLRDYYAREQQQIPFTIASLRLP